jgi:hypothetical protein
MPSMLQFINNAKDITPIPTVNHNLTRDIMNLTISCKNEGEINEITFLVSYSIEWTNYILTHEGQSYLPDFSIRDTECCTIIHVMQIMGVFFWNSQITFNEFEYKQSHNAHDHSYPKEICPLSKIESADIFVNTSDFPFIITKLKTSDEADTPPHDTE